MPSIYHVCQDIRAGGGASSVRYSEELGMSEETRKRILLTPVEAMRAIFISHDPLFAQRSTQNARMKNVPKDK